HRDTREPGRYRQQPPRVMPPNGLKPQCAQQDDHDKGDQPAHRSRCGRRAVVVTRDRSEHGLWQLATRASMSENLDVEHQVHPQDGEQEPAASREQRGHALLFRKPVSVPRRGHVQQDFDARSAAYRMSSVRMK
ncbi:MAG: hypothetical protein QOE94_1973, partial [Mycobacterium sp.]|nr:hypothetical protein [Mycobacterium sp.]